MELLLVGAVDDVHQVDDVGVGLELFEDGDFPHGCRWDAFVFVLEFDFLQGHDLLGLAVAGFEDHAVGSLADGFYSFVVVDFHSSQLI